MGSLSSRYPDPADVAWVNDTLGAELAELWLRMSAPDQRHSVLVARQLSESDDRIPNWVLSAAMLHDVGKVESPLGTFGRVAATVVRPLRGRIRWPASFRSYWEHPERGQRLVLEYGGDERTAAWCAEHHRPTAGWTVPLRWGHLLKQCDND